MKNPYRNLEKAIGYRFRRRIRLENALTHRSFRYEQAAIEEDNQRLEFLGDAVLGMLTAAHLFAQHPDLQEGELTRLRSQVTSSEPLAQIAAACGIGEHLRLGRGEEQSGGRRRPSNLTDALEAVLGAAYRDGGVRAVEKIFGKLFVPRIEELSPGGGIDNPKGRLQELVQQRWRVTPRYRISAEEGPSHHKVYTAEVLLRDRVYGAGRGTNKRAAQAQAARQALIAVEPLDALPATDDA